MLAPREEVAACTLGGRALVVQALLVFEEAKAAKAALAATLTPLLLSAAGAHGLLSARQRGYKGTTVPNKSPQNKLVS